MLTLGDPFKATASIPLEEDWRQFDTHAYVLRGVNEQVLRLDSVLSTLIEFGDALAVRVFLDLPESHSKEELSLSEAVELTCREPRTWGSFALRITKLKSLHLPPIKMRQGPFLPADLIESAFRDRASAFRFVGALVTQDHVTTDLFNPRQNRWLQLNGWRILQPEHPGLRLAYERGRLFLPLQSVSSRYLNVEWMLPDCADSAESNLEIRANGQLLRRATVLRGVWYSWSFELDQVETETQCVCVEISLPSCGWPAGQTLKADHHIAVRRATIEPAPIEDEHTLSSEPCLEALVATFSAGELPPIQFGPDTYEGLSALRAIQKLRPNHQLSVHAGPKQISFLSSFPWLLVTCLSPVGDTHSAAPPSPLQGPPRFFVGYPLGSILPNGPGSWWLDGQGRPTAEAAICRTTLRESLRELRDGDEGMERQRQAVALGAARGKAESLRIDLAKTKAKLIETRGKLADKRAELKGKKIQRLKAPIAAKVGWVSRLFGRKPEGS